VQQVVEDFFFHDKVTRLVWTSKLPFFAFDNQTVTKKVPIDTDYSSFGRQERYLARHLLKYDDYSWW
jgi:hypothetical protein